MPKVDCTDKVIKTSQRAEDALRTLIANGDKISQSAVEKLAGLSNGTLNYDVPEYQDIKKRINIAKSATAETAIEPKGNRGELQNQIRLKDKYRKERNELRSEIKKLIGEKTEIMHKLFELQRYVAFLDEEGIASCNVVKFRSKKKNSV